VREHDRVIERDATPHQSVPSRAQTPRDQASPYHPGRTRSYKTIQYKAIQKRKRVPAVSVYKNDIGKMIPHQIPCNRCGSSLDLSHITRTRRPSSLASGSGSVSAGPAGAGDAGMGGVTSIDIPRQPAFWRFRGIGVGGGGGLGTCARTLAEKTAS
jgi:hypothetical protein